MLINEDEILSTSISLNANDIENNTKQIIIDSINSIMHENQQPNLQSVSLDSASLDLNIKNEDSNDNNVNCKDIIIHIIFILFLILAALIVLLVLYYLSK